MPTPVLRRTGPAVLTVGLSLFAACTTAQPEPSPGPTAAAFAPEFAGAACPADVEVTLLVDHSCGYLTVLQNRSDDDGATARLLVVRMDPPGGAASPDPVLVAGADIGDEPQIGSFAPLAARVGRTVYVLEPRGVGHSVPALTCPEVEELAVEVVASPSDDEGSRALPGRGRGLPGTAGRGRRRHRRIRRRRGGSRYRGPAAGAGYPAVEPRQLWQQLAVRARVRAPLPRRSASLRHGFPGVSAVRHRTWAGRVDGCHRQPVGGLCPAAGVRIRRARPGGSASRRHCAA